MSLGEATTNCAPISNKSFSTSLHLFPELNFFTSPIAYLSNFSRRLLIKVLRQGPIPQHVGFVMDGNRRFAKKIQVQTGEGHYMGFQKLEEVLEICLELGIKVVTVYAFSIENFKRPKEEVDTLMNLARKKLRELYENNDVVSKYGVSIRILGNKTLLPEDLLIEMEKAEDATKRNNRTILNLCCPYTSRDEIATAVRKVVIQVEKGETNISEIDEKLLDSKLYTNGCPPLEILIRTSGETRLSDFLLWQCHEKCNIHFVNCYWPEFSLWEMLPIILDYQRGFLGRR
ncbi:905_t:CDS:2 [Ambispora leptoticha]|uniref:Alkyl transferase n=1 Tax=Ambispora leptoticha TaxID=144679 RepID=A0A9N8ZTW9_9GLOM|nr:905_t:CDS:2 [Ambispora leptoticha]